MHSMASGVAFFTIIERRASCAANGCKFFGNGSLAPASRWFGTSAENFSNQKCEICVSTSLARNAVGHDDIEGGNAVAGDEQKTVAEVEDFADLAGADFFDAGQIKLENQCVVHRAKNKVPSAQCKAQSGKSTKLQHPSTRETSS